MVGACVCSSTESTTSFIFFIMAPLPPISRYGLGYFFSSWLHYLPVAIGSSSSSSVSLQPLRIPKRCQGLDQGVGVGFRDTGKGRKRVKGRVMIRGRGRRLPHRLEPSEPRQTRQPGTLMTQHLRKVCVYRWYETWPQQQHGASTATASSS